MRDRARFVSRMYMSDNKVSWMVNAASWTLSQVRNGFPSFVTSEGCRYTAVSMFEMHGIAANSLLRYQRQLYQDQRLWS